VVRAGLPTLEAIIEIDEEDIVAALPEIDPETAKGIRRAALEKVKAGQPANA